MGGVNTCKKNSNLKNKYRRCKEKKTLSESNLMCKTERKYVQ